MKMYDKKCMHGFIWLMTPYPCHEGACPVDNAPGWYYCDCVTHGGLPPCKRPYGAREVVARLALAKMNGGDNE